MEQDDIWAAEAAWHQAATSSYWTPLPEFGSSSTHRAWYSHSSGMAEGKARQSSSCSSSAARAASSLGLSHA